MNIRLKKGFFTRKPTTYTIAIPISSFFSPDSGLFSVFCLPRPAKGPSPGCAGTGLDSGRFHCRAKRENRSSTGVSVPWVGRNPSDDAEISWLGRYRYLSNHSMGEDQ